MFCKLNIVHELLDMISIHFFCTFVIRGNTIFYESVKRFFCCITTHQKYSINLTLHEISGENHAINYVAICENT